MFLFFEGYTSADFYAIRFNPRFDGGFFLSMIQQTYLKAHRKNPLLPALQKC